MMSSDNNARIAKNSLLLYSRTLITMFISLYTSRIILKLLGVEDFGVYNVVGGVVIMFQLMSGSLSSATQRFLTFELGKKNFDESKNVFSTALIINSFIAFSLILFIEIIGLWILNTKLNIPSERITAANWVFQFALIQFIINLIGTPYSASIIAHEKMNVVAYVGVFESVLKLFIVILISYINFDKLIIFGILMLMLTIITNIINITYCLRNFAECKFVLVKDKSIFKSMLGFSGWNLIGSTSHALLTQGTNILINLFFGVNLNAARGITVQVETAINQFVGNFMSALNPQITKYYASMNYSEMNKLMQRGAKFSFFLFYLFALPIFLQTETILSLWLVEVPDYTVIFIRLNLIVTLIYTLSNTYLTGIFATGAIKYYQINIAIIVFVMFTITYVFLKLGFKPEITYVIYIIIALFVFVSRLYAINKLIGIHFSGYFNHVLKRVISVIALSLPFPLFLNTYLNNSTMKFIFISLISIIFTIISVFFIGFDKVERKKVENLLKSKASRIMLK